MALDPLSKFAVPGVIEAKKEVLKEAALLIHEKYPDHTEPFVAELLLEIFALLNRKGGVITAQALADLYSETTVTR